MTAISASRITGSKRARFLGRRPAVVRRSQRQPSPRRRLRRQAQRHRRVVRVQGYRGQFIVGASYARSNPYLSPRFAVGRQAFAGADVRWAHPSGLQARGEFLKGHSHEGVSTIGFRMASSIGQEWDRSRRSFVVNGSTTSASAPRARGEATDAGDASAPAGSGHAAVELLASAATCRISRPIDRPSATYSLRLDPEAMASSIRKEYDGTTAWRRVAAGILLLVRCRSRPWWSPRRAPTRSAVARAADNLEGRALPSHRLVDERAGLPPRQTRLITELPLFRSMMINPVIAKDATLTKWPRAIGRISTRQFATRPTRTDPSARQDGRPDASCLLQLQTAVRGAAAGESRRDIVAIDGRLILVTAEPAKFAQAEVLRTVTFGFPLDDAVQQLAQIARGPTSTSSRAIVSPAA